MTSVSYECTAYTTKVRWRIEKFSAVASRDDPDVIKSSNFSLYKSRLQFFLQFEPVNQEEDGSKEHSALYLMPQNLDNEKSVDLKWAMWIENLDAKKISYHG
jgi:hypothetical protein